MDIHKLAALPVMLWTAWSLDVGLKWASECGHNILHLTFQHIVGGYIFAQALHAMMQSCVLQEFRKYSYMPKGSDPAIAPFCGFELVDEQLT